MSKTNQSIDDSDELRVKIDSINYYVRREGPFNTPTVVLIHALMANHHIYDSTVLPLHATGYQTLRFDHVGHNQTPAPNHECNLTFDDICRHIHGIYQAAMTKWSFTGTPAAIIGCSIGGVLALRYQMLYPTLNIKIISMAAPGLSTLPGAKEKWDARIKQWEKEGNNKNLAKATLERWFPNQPADFDREKATSIVESCSLEGYRTCARATCSFDYTEQLSSIKNGENVMILAGADDGNIGPREVLQDASRRIVGSQYVLLDGVGHIPPMHPEVFEPVMLNFLQQ